MTSSHASRFTFFRPVMSVVRAASLKATKLILGPLPIEPQTDPDGLVFQISSGVNDIEEAGGVLNTLCEAGGDGLRPAVPSVITNYAFAWDSDDAAHVSAFVVTAFGCISTDEPLMVRAKTPISSWSYYVVPQIGTAHDAASTCIEIATADDTVQLVSIDVSSNGDVSCNGQISVQDAIFAGRFS